MGKDPKVKTERDSFLFERLVGGSHHKTTVSDGKDRVEARGRTSHQSRERALDKWASKKASK